MIENNTKKESPKSIQEDVSILSDLLKHITSKNIKLISYSLDHVIYEDENKVVRHILKKGDKVIDTIEKTPNVIEPNFKANNKPKKNIRTRKGKIISPNAKIIFASVLMGAGLATAAWSLHGSSAEELPKIEIEVEEIPLKPEIEAKNTNEKDKIQVQEETISKPEEAISPREPDVIISENTVVEVAQRENMAKREETDALFGSIINIYTSRYGIPNAIGCALITQERPNSNNINVGQLTRNICGEKMQIPTFDAENQVNGIEKIYVVREMPQKENFEQEESYKKELDRYKKQLEESKKLSEEGYSIYDYQTVIQNPEMCIHISMAYLAHCVYQCDMNVSQGIRGYNGGYPIAKMASDLEISKGSVTDGDAYYNEHVYSYLYYDELENLKWHLASLNTLKNNENWSNEERVQKEKEQAMSAPIIEIHFTFLNVRGLNYEEENAHRL